MLLIFPLVTFAAIFFSLVAFQQSRPFGIGWRFAFIQAAVWTGAYLALSAEVLSLFKLLTPAGVSAAWIPASLFSVWFGWRKGLLRQGFVVFLQRIKTINQGEAVLIALFATVVSVLGLIALIAVPNTTDSLHYHMSRVMHWTQARSLAHYPTGYEPQLVNPIWAELTILHMRLLLGTDRLANFVQWSALGGSLVVVTLIASLLGVNRKGQIASAAFALSLPITLLQATSTQNDLITAFWLLSLAVFVILASQRTLYLDELLGLSLALGLGLLTKGTFYPYSVPLGIWFLIVLFRNFPLPQALLKGILITICAVLLNLGYWGRNFATYQNPLGSANWVENQTASEFGVIKLFSSLTRNTIVNFVTPNDEFNDQMLEWMQNTFGEYDASLEQFRMIWGWNHEDLAGNPLHVLFVGASLIGLLLVYKRLPRKGLVGTYVLSALGMFVMLSLVLHTDNYGIRFQLPFFLAWAPVFGVVVSSLSIRLGIKDKLPVLIILSLLISTLPWVFFNRTRPLIAMREINERYTIGCYLGCTSIGSILLEEPGTVLFANHIHFREPYKEVSAVIRASGCNRVGLSIDSNDHEYPFWWLLGAPESGIRIESMYYSPQLERYKDPSFEPCAIICTVCSTNLQAHGLDFTGIYGPVRLYQQLDY